MALPRATYYRKIVVKPAPEARSEQTAASQESISGDAQGDNPAARCARRSPRGLQEAEEQKVLAALHSERFVDRSPGQVYATLLDEGSYLCSERTMYRILEKHQEVKDRRNQRRHPEYKKPELLATAPNEVWSWDITKLRGPAKWTYFYLYVILDIFSRYVVGWMVATRETAALAQQLIKQTCRKQGIGRGELLLHADRGSPMKAKTTALLLADLGIGKSQSRPHVSNDNPFSESQFKTLKYNPQFPERFGSPMDARAFCGPFFQWYNTEFRYSGIAMMTPEMVHYGLAGDVRANRERVLAQAYAAHPERFVRGKPKPTELPGAVWINPPAKGVQMPGEVFDSLCQQEALA
jgi:putative transposase